MAEPFIPYTADAFLKSKAAGAPIDPARTDQMHKFMSSFADQKAFSAPTIKGLGTNKWGTVYVVGQASDPIWKVTGSSIAPWLKSNGFHAPEALGSMLTGTSDSPFCVMDRGTGVTVFGTKASKTGAHTISVQSGGCMFHTSNGLDGRNPKSNEKRNWTSRGRISEALVIRRDLVDYGIANNCGVGHVLHMFCAATGGGHCHPMVGDEGNRGGFGMEGERIIIKPEVDLTKRGLTPFGLVIARTLQEHGMYIGDNAGKESTLKAQQTAGGTNPWNGLVVSDKCLQGKITWADMAVVKAGWQ